MELALRTTLLLALLLGNAFAQQNLIPNGDFSDREPLKGWRVDFPYQSWYVKNVDYVRGTTQEGRKCVEISLPPGVAGMQGGKVETALIPAVPGATYKVSIDCMTWDFTAKMHAEAYTTDPRPGGTQSKSLFIIPGTNGAPNKVMCWRAQLPDPPGASHKWSTVSREFTVTNKVSIAGVECKPEFIVVKAVVFYGTMGAGKSYFTNFRLTRVR